MKKLLLSVAALGCFVAAQAQWTTSGTNVYNTTLGNSVGIGTATPQAKLEVYNSVGAGGTAGNFKLLSRLSTSNHTTGGNIVMQNIWIKRDANGDSWATARFHDALSVDGSYLTPGSDTKTWWERDPWDNIQSWGSGSETHMTIAQGKVGIGTTTPGSYKLAVEGKVGAREVVVTTAPWADHVFAGNYKLRPLSEVARFIEENKHLPEVPTAAEVAKNGNSLAETDALLLKKIEELTLYVIEQHKQLQKVQQENQELKNTVETLRK